MKVLSLLSILSFIVSTQAMAALHPQFSECLFGDSASVSTQDVKDIAQVYKVT